MSIDHRAEAERRLLMAWEEDSTPERNAHLVAEAQVHATLARDEEQAASSRDLKDTIAWLRRRERETRDLVSTHIAKALASRKPDRWKAGRELAQALDEAECNMDDLIDARLSDDGYDTKMPWTFPVPVRSDDPWAATPDITADIPEPVRRLFAEHIAQMLLNGDGETVQLWARNFVFALKNVGADLTPDIEKRITELTLGRDPSDPPF